MSSITESNIFEFVSEKEEKKFSTYIAYISDLISNDSEYFLKKISNYQNQLYTGIEAFKIILSLAISKNSSANLIHFYSFFSSIKDLNPEVAEIVLDSLMDLSRYRASKPDASTDDKIFHKIFEKYEESCFAIFDIVDGLINSMMTVYDSSSFSEDEKRMHLIKEAIPVIVEHAKTINHISDENYFDIWLIHFISILKGDLTKIKRSSESRFRLFFNQNELLKIQNLSGDQLQTYLASAAAENPNLKEAKNLLKAILDCEFYLKKIATLINEINITPEIEAEVENFLSEKMKISVERANE